MRFSLQVASLLPSIDSLPRKREYESPLKCHGKILRTPDCHGLDADLIIPQLFWGEQPPFIPSVWGAVIFLDHEIGCVWLVVTTKRPNGSTSEMRLRTP